MNPIRTKLSECYYDTLGLPMDAPSGKIKKAYYKKSLQYHPDKNREDPQAAKEIFQKIQRAYSVLSDPHERAWYDDHREAILGLNDEEEELNLLAYFSSSMWDSYDSSSKNNFFSVYSTLFSLLAKLEKKNSPDYIYPEFGGPDTSSSEIESFYSKWSNFCSHKQFSSEDKWNINDAESRGVRRAMQRENEAARNKARKEFSKTVQELVAYVKKRDIRLKRVQMEAAAAESERQANLKRMRDLNDEQTIALLNSLEESIEQARIDYDQELDLLESDLYSSEEEDSSDDEPILDFWCEICKKKFKSSGAFDTHVRSKSHRKKAEKFKKQKSVPAKNPTFSTQTHQNDADFNLPLENENPLENDTLETIQHDSKDSGVGAAAIPIRSENYCQVCDKEFSSLGALTAHNNSKSHRRTLKLSLKKSHKATSKKQKKQKPNPKGKQQQSPRSDISGTKTVKQQPQPTEPAPVGEISTNIYSAFRETSTPARTHPVPTTPGSFPCMICKQSFSSRTKLFTHIRMTGHAANKDDLPPRKKSKSKKSKKKNKS